MTVYLCLLRIPTLMGMAGVSSLIEWLAAAYPEPPEAPVLIVDIRSFPDGQVREATQNQSAIFQLYAPLLALFGVRDSSQMLRGQDALQSLDRVWAGKLERATFTFADDGAPLSWRSQLARIQSQWRRTIEIGDSENQKSFQRGMAFLGR